MINKSKYNFYLDKSRAEKSLTNQSIIQCIIHINKDRLMVSTNVSCPIKIWDNVKKIAKGQTQIAKNVNDKINQFIITLQEIELEANKKNEKLDGATLRNRLFKTEAPQGYTILELYQHYIDKKSGREGTKTNRKIKMKNIKIFLKEVLEVDDLPYNDLKRHHADDMYDFFTKTKEFSNNHASKIIMELVAVFKKAVQREMIEKNIFEGVNIPQRYTKERKYLELAELEMIEKKDFNSPMLRHIADCFLFQCYTGVSYADLVTLKQEHITSIEVNGTMRYFIEKVREKSQDGKPLHFSVPLDEKALKIIEKYGDITKLPTICNQTYNRLLKELGALVGFKRFLLTTHVGRKTFANIGLNYKNIDTTTMEACMGDKAETIRKHYAQSNRNRVINNIEKFF